ncbi:Hippocampus abundant transcript 1 protein [Blattella germanica]|nr:Hippocampus abundant transcript 1 protein [Blattella germanica]
MPTKVSKKVVGMIIRSRKTIMKDGVMTTSGIGDPSVHHALVVIFLEFFAWGLLTMPVISVLNETFPDHTFLMNGLIMGIKGLLSFLSAPLIGALSDVWGRKFFLLITVFFTWFFAMISISGVFAVTFSVVFAYVADVTEEQERSLAYGLVSATFAASMVISPALGAYMMDAYSENLVVALATAIAILDVFFILVAVPESLPEKVRPSSWGAPISWEQADPFAVMGFTVVMVAVFIATVGILSVCAQIVLGMMWAAGVLASVSSITYPAISAFVSMHSDADKQGLVQGMVTGMRGLCNGLGPAMFGVIFYLFHVDLNEDTPPGRGREQRPLSAGDNNTAGQIFDSIQPLVPGPPFVFGAFLVICALLVAVFIPDGTTIGSNLRTSSRRQSDVSSSAARRRETAEDDMGDDPTWFHRPKLRLQGLSMELQYEVQHSKKHDGISPLSPLVDNSAVL